MLDHETRSAILRLRQEGHGTRLIAEALGISRGAVLRVLKSGRVDVPKLERPDHLTPHTELIRDLHHACKGNLVRVQQELLARHKVDVAYSTLTRFCRQAEIGVKPKQASGRYEFDPGEEMQHDTSPHDVEVGGRRMRLQCASLVMCFSHRRFIQCYPRWTRFHVKAFLTRALVFFGGAAKQCMLDNSTVIMTGGTGKSAHPVPEMESFSQHFGFEFVAHEKGDANRSARVEGAFNHVENNFYAGRTFADLDDLNRQAIAWCEWYNSTFNRHYKAIPDDLARFERDALSPLPLHVPEPTEVHPRLVDAEAFVHLHTNRYSVPEAFIGQSVEVQEQLDLVRVFLGHRLLAEHPRLHEGAGGRLTADGHRGQRLHRKRTRPPSDEERALRTAGPALAAACDALTKTTGGGRRALARLHRIWLDYPTEAVEQAVQRAMEFGLVDPDRIERMVLRGIRGDFFKLPKEDADG